MNKQYNTTVLSCHQRSAIEYICKELENKLTDESSSEAYHWLLERKDYYSRLGSLNNDYTKQVGFLVTIIVEKIDDKTSPQVVINLVDAFNLLLKE